jgi:CheY-like chemotaxis protein
MHARHKILVVDDLPDWRTTLSGLLVDEGYEVQVAGSLNEALDFLGRVSFDLALLDVRLDESDEDNREGLELANKIRQQWPHVLIVIITGYETQDTISQAMKPDSKGRKLADDYVPKNESEKIVRVIRETLEKQIR